MTITMFTVSFILLISSTCMPYTNGLQITGCQKFIYADETDPTFAELPHVFFAGVAQIEDYCRRSQLKRSIPKTVCCFFMHTGLVMFNL